MFGRRAGRLERRECCGGVYGGVSSCRRPIFHQTQSRSDGHLFITVIAYQMVQTIRRRLGEQGESESWTSLRRILEGQHRVTATFQRKDGRTFHVRKATRAEPRQQEIYRALALDPAPGGIRKMIV